MTHLGQNIARLRGMRRLTQKEMASKLNLGQPDYSKIEQKAEIDEELLVLIANALEVAPEAIRNFNEEAAVSIISNNTLSDNAAIIGNNPIYNFNPIDKLIEVIEANKDLYERLIKEKDIVIEMYKQQQKAS